MTIFAIGRAAVTPTSRPPNPNTRLPRKGEGKEAKLSYQANALMENRNGLLVGVDVCHATGTSEREGALRLIDEMYLGKNYGWEPTKDTTHASSPPRYTIEESSRIQR